MKWCIDASGRQSAHFTLGSIGKAEDLCLARHPTPISNSASAGGKSTFAAMICESHVGTDEWPTYTYRFLCGQMPSELPDFPGLNSYIGLSVVCLVFSFILWPLVLIFPLQSHFLYHENTIRRKKLSIKHLQLLDKQSIAVSSIQHLSGVTD